MQSTEGIRKRKEAMRKQIKKSLKLPRVFGLKKSPDKPVQNPQKSVKLDKRYFHNIFKLNEKLGEGANGYVHKCTQIKTGNIYAVKILEGDEQFVRIVKQTYQILKLFDHETIIKGKCCFIDENTQQIYLVMEYCQYPSLAKTIHQNNLSDHSIKAIVSKLLQSVNLLHQASVCHRDIKPQNVLYDPENNKIKIIDFGISKATYNRRTLEKEAMWTVTGSQYYKAPEMLNGSSYDEKVDVWAIGVIAYQLIFGCLPFYSEYASQVIEQIMYEQPDFTSQHVTALDIDFIKALLRKDPRSRLSCAQALRHPWIENQIRYKKSDDLSSSDNIFLRYEMGANRKFSPSISTLMINQSPINVKDLDLQNGIIQIHKDLDMNNWISLRHRSSSIMYSSSPPENNSVQNVSSIEYQISMVGLEP